MLGDFYLIPLVEILLLKLKFPLVGFPINFLTTSISSIGLPSSDFFFLFLIPATNYSSSSSKESNRELVSIYE